jgi:hypothetical protein
MNFRKLIIFIVTMSCMTMPVQSASHEKKVLQDIKAKIEKDNKVSQLDKDKEDDLPLNNPFAGDGANKKKKIQNINEEGMVNDPDLDLVNYKLSGIMLGDKDGYATLVDGAGIFYTIKNKEYLNKNLQLIVVSISEATFRNKNEEEFTINFKQEVKKIK